MNSTANLFVGLASSSRFRDLSHLALALLLPHLKPLSKFAVREQVPLVAHSGAKDNRSMGSTVQARSAPATSDSPGEHAATMLSGASLVDAVAVRARGGRQVLSALVAVGGLRRSVTHTEGGDIEAFLGASHSPLRVLH